MEQLTSTANPRVKALVRLREPSERRRTGLFLLETAREMARALEAGYAVRELYVCADAAVDEALVERVAGSGGKILGITRPILDKITYRQNPQPMVAVAEAKPLQLEDLALGDDALVVVLTGLEKPGNIGAILRTADAAGVDAVLIDSADGDLYNPHCIRASTGAVFSVPVVCAEGPALREYLAAQGLTIVTASPEAGVAYTRAPLADAVAIVLGSEDQGLSAEWRAEADQPVCVPMFGEVDSLNVSVTAALLMYEARRQRANQDRVTRASDTSS